MLALFALMFFRLASASRGEASLNSLHPSVKIVGGVVAEITDVPYQVSLRNQYGQHFCGGTIISSHGILTAAHCVVETSGMLYVAAGVSRLDEDVLHNPVTNIIVHVNYDNGTMMNDLAVLRVKLDLELDNVTKRAIPIATETPLNGTMCTTSGWGTTRFDLQHQEASLQLRITSLPICNNELCSALLQSDVSISQICAGFREGGHDSCQGDSGGPLECDGSITGIVSWGLGCGAPNTPGVYTSVPYYKDWILAHVNSSHSLPANTFLIGFFLVISVMVPTSQMFVDVG